jgi:hypothetical protein
VVSHFERYEFGHRFVIWLTCSAVAKLAKTFHDNWFFSPVAVLKTHFLIQRKTGRALMIVACWHHKTRWDRRVIGKFENPMGQVFSNVADIIFSHPPLLLNWLSCPAFAPPPPRPRFLRPWDGENERGKKYISPHIGSRAFLFM